MDVRIYDDELAEALKQLPEKKRNNVLMYYFLEMSDTEIADVLNHSSYPKRAMWYNRQNQRMVSDRYQ